MVSSSHGWIFQPCLKGRLAAAVPGATPLVSKLRVPALERGPGHWDAAGDVLWSRGKYVNSGLINYGFMDIL